MTELIRELKSTGGGTSLNLCITAKRLSRSDPQPSVRHESVRSLELPAIRWADRRHNSIYNRDYADLANWRRSDHHLLEKLATAQDILALMRPAACWRRA